jgi:hypothetical protein
VSASGRVPKKERTGEENGTRISILSLDLCKQQFLGFGGTPGVVFVGTRMRQKRPNDASQKEG